MITDPMVMSDLSCIEAPQGCSPDGTRTRNLSQVPNPEAKAEKSLSLWTQLWLDLRVRCLPLPLGHQAYCGDA